MDTSQGTSYRPISLLFPVAKVLESLILPTINKYILPAQAQHGFRREHSTTSALPQLTTYIAVGFNQRKPPDRTVCVAAVVSAAFDTVCHNNLLSKINRSQLPPATARWLSCYLRGRQAKTCFTGVNSTSKKVNTGVLKGSKLSPSLFGFYIADMPRPADPVERISYADDLTVWASGVNIPDLEVILKNYLDEITVYLKVNSLLISAPKSSVTLLTPDTHQANTHPSRPIEDTRFGRYILGATEGNNTDDLQGSRKIDHQLRSTCLESKPTRHQLQKNQLYRERCSEGSHWLSQDVQYLSPTHRSRDAES